VEIFALPEGTPPRNEQAPTPETSAAKVRQPKSYQPPKTVTTLNRTEILCVYCNKMYADLQCLRQHVKHVHPELKIKCNFRKCNTYFLTEDHLQKHQQELKHCNRGVDKFKCAKRSSIIKHLANHAGRIKCPECPSLLKNEATLKSHQKSVHGLKETCKFCGEKRSFMKMHLLRKSVCKLCDKVIECGGQYREHIKVCKPKICCDECGLSFKHPYELKYHKHVKNKKQLLQKSISKKKNFISVRANSQFCHLCSKHLSLGGEKFRPHAKTREHLHNLHNAPFTCDLCSKQYMNLYKISKHLTATHGFGCQKTFKCPKCDKSFKRKDSVNVHLRQIHDNSMTKCKICEKVVKASYLRGHELKIHHVN
jgi:hypothetical protein